MRLLLSATEDPPEDLSPESRLAARNPTHTHTRLSAATLLVQVKAKGNLLKDLRCGPDAGSLCVSGCSWHVEQLARRGFQSDPDFNQAQQFKLPSRPNQMPLKRQQTI